MAIPVHLSAAAVNSLTFEAAERNVSPATLAAAILATVSKDDLIDAVLEGVDLHKFGGEMNRAPLTPRAEEVLSYMMGLAPVGADFEMRTSELLSDLRITRQGLSNITAQLIVAGYIERVASGRGLRRSVYRVLKRLH